jgi:arylsulfatase A-like enzyme
VAVQVGRWLRGREGVLLSFLRRSLPALVVAALIAGQVGARWDGWRERRLVSGLVAAPQQAPNLLVIVLDTLRADHVSAYGYGRPTTPNIDRLAREGVLFEHALANSSWTLPSHASLLTGRLPHEHGADWLDPLNATYPTLAEVLAARGYVTAAFAANTSYVSPEWGLARGFSRFDVYGNTLADDVVRTVYGRKLALNVLPRLGYFDIPGRKRAADVNAEFLGWLDRIPDRPFFALLNYFDVHDPYLTATEYELRFAAEVSRGDLVNFQFQPNVFRRKPTLSAGEIQMEIDAYDGCLAYLDAELGRLFAALAARGLGEQTLVVLTSDHGESFGNHDLFGHGNSLYFESLHVPLILFWPRMIPSGVRIAGLASLHQIPATVTDLLGIEAAPLPGQSLAGRWTAEAGGAVTDAVLSEVSSGRFQEAPPNYPTSAGGLRSLVTDQWHLIVSASGTTELYAWRGDRDEARNLANTPAGQAALPALMREFPAL